MINVQNNFACSETQGGGPPLYNLSVPFTSPNARGNGLIAVAFCATQPFGSPPRSMPIDLVAADEANNSWLRIGGCGKYDGSKWTTLLAAWYVQSCAGGANTFLLTERLQLSNYLLAAGVFEYPGALGAAGTGTPGTGIAYPNPVQGVDDLQLGCGAGTSGNVSLSISAPKSDLLFAYGVEFGQAGTLSLDSSSTGYATEQQRSKSNSSSDFPSVVRFLAVGQVAAAAGVKAAQFDCASSSSGLWFGLLAAMSLTAVPGQPPPPTPTPTPTPSPGTPGGPLPPLSSGVWPTIF